MLLSNALFSGFLDNFYFLEFGTDVRKKIIRFSKFSASQLRVVVKNKD